MQQHHKDRSEGFDEVKDQRHTPMDKMANISQKESTSGTDRIVHQDRFDDDANRGWKKEADEAEPVRLEAQAAEQSRHGYG